MNFNRADRAASATQQRLAEVARLVLITDDGGDVERTERIVTAAVASGVRAVQLREERMSASHLVGLCDRLRPTIEEVDGLLLVNDRVDAAVAAHGVHLGRRSIPPAAARRLLGADAVIGYSAHEAADTRWAAEQGADYVSLSPVFPTKSKPDVAVLGVGRTREIVASAPLPVVWLGGFDAQRIDTAAVHQPFGVAVMSAICSAPDPAAVAADLLMRLDVRPAPR